MNEGLTRILMPGYMLRHHRMGHPVMGEIGPRRIAVFIGYAYRLVLLSFFVRFSFGSRSVLDRFSFGSRLFFDHSSFILRSGIEEQSRIERRTIEERTKDDRRTNEDVTITHRC